MQKTDKLDGLVINASFNITNAAGVKINGCNVTFTLDGVTIGDVLDGPVRKSLVIDLQRALRPLSESAIRKLCVDQTYTVHASQAGHKPEDPEARKRKALATLKGMSVEELEELGFTAEQIEALKG